MEDRPTISQIEAMLKALSLGRYIVSAPSLNGGAEKAVEKAMLLKHVMGHATVYEITEAGKQFLRNEMVNAVQVNIPDQPPLILRDAKALLDDIQAGILDTTLELLEYGDYGTGDILFTVSAKRISLYDLTTLPEWEPV